MKQKAILITGSPHSGTRLILNMLSRHPDISVPNEILNLVGEFPPLHNYFSDSLKNTPLHAKNYNYDYEELKFILDSYLLNVDKSKPFLAVKMPFYPLTCLDFFYNYFGEGLYVLFTERSKEKVVTSYWRRAEDKKYFNDPEKLMIQVKKLNVDKRKQALTSNELIFPGIVEACNEGKEQWNKENPNKQIITINLKEVASSQEVFAKLLDKMDLKPKKMDEIYKVLNKGRLSTGLKTKVKNKIWRTLVNLGYKGNFNRNLL